MIKQIEWCGYTWNCEMDCGRIIREETPYMWCDGDMVSVDENGVLTLNACVKPKHITTWDGKEFDPKYAVGTIRNANPKDVFTYGRYSCEIQIPDGNNCWNSFWLMAEDGIPWPEGGEIDIMEAFQNKSSYFVGTIPQPPYFVPSWWVTTNFHYAENGEHKSYGSRGIPLCKLLRNPKKHFVNYGCEWLPDKVTFFVNGKKTREIKNPPMIHDRMRVIFDCWGKELDFKVTQPMKCKNFVYEGL